MKTGRTLQQLAAEIERQHNVKADYIAPVGKMQLVVPAATHVPALSLAGVDDFNLNPLAHQHLGEYVNIPKPYYDRMMSDAPDLLATNVNNWLARLSKGATKEQRLVRVLDGRVRSLHSDRYRALDNFDLANAVFPVLADKNLTVLSCEVTDRRLYIKAFDRSIEREIAVKGTDPAHTFLKDVCFAAVTISNSEVGCGALMVAAGMYTGGCTNFAAFSDSRMRKYHVGGKAIESENIQAMLSDKTKALTDAALWAQTRDVVASAFDRIAFDALVSKVQDTADQRIEGDVVKVVEKASSTFGFTQGEKSSVLKHLIEGGTLSRYGLFNAITRAAEDATDYDRASEMERVGGRVIELPRNDWEAIAKAA